MSFLSTQKQGYVTIRCPLCQSNKAIKESSIKNYKKRKSIGIKCTCGCRFIKQLQREDLHNTNLISAIINLDMEILWYKITHLLQARNLNDV